MGVPTSEVGYTIATTRRQNTKVHKNMWWHWNIYIYIYIVHNMERIRTCTKAEFFFQEEVLGLSVEILLFTKNFTMPVYWMRSCSVHCAHKTFFTNIYCIRSAYKDVSLKMQAGSHYQILLDVPPSFKSYCSPIVTFHAEAMWSTATKLKYHIPCATDRPFIWLHVISWVIALQRFRSDHSAVNAHVKNRGCRREGVWRPH